MPRRKHTPEVDAAFRRLARERITSCLEKHKISFEDVTVLDREIHVSIHLGDWKHSHLALDHLMRTLGYTKRDETDVRCREEGILEDCYSSTHVYARYARR